MLKDEEGLRDAVIGGDRDRVRALVSEALAGGADPVEVLDAGLLPAMNVVGERFGAKTMFITEVLLTARAMHAGLEVLRPALARSPTHAGPRPVVVLGTVKGDLHDIGKNLVAMILEAGGFDVVDLGTNVGTEAFLRAIQKHQPAVVGLSALLTTTMRQMRHTIEELRRSEAADGVKIVIGGAPVTQEFANTIGADGYAADAASAVMAVKRLVAA
jgi:5-methyltetrahydrofolate--homocysteine methyltransferase